MRFDNVHDFEIYRDRLKQFPIQIEQFIASFRLGMETGYTCSLSQVFFIACDQYVSVCLCKHMRDTYIYLYIRRLPHISYIWLRLAVCYYFGFIR